MNFYTVLPQQSLFDIAIEVYGDVDAVFWLLDDNPTLIGLTDRLQVGQQISVRDVPMNPRQAVELALFAPFQTINEEDRPAGIGFWRTEEYQVG